MRPPDPFAHHTTRWILLALAALLGGGVALLGQLLVRVAVPPSVLDLFPRGATAFVATFPPATRGTVDETPLLRLARVSVDDALVRAYPGRTLALRSSSVGAAWVLDGSSLARIDYWDGPGPHPAGSRTVRGWTFLAASPRALDAIVDDPLLGISSDPRIAALLAQLPASTSCTGVAAPELLAPAIAGASRDRNVRGITEFVAGVATRIPVLSFASHASSGFRALTVALPQEGTSRDRALALPENASSLAVASPQHLLTVRGDSTTSALVVSRLATLLSPAFRTVLQSDTVTFAFADATAATFARRTLGWSADTALTDGMLRDALRMRLATPQAFALPDGSTGRELRGPDDASLPIVVDGAWRIVSAEGITARSRIDGPDLLVLDGERTDWLKDEPIPRTFRARLRAVDIPALVGAAGDQFLVDQPAALLTTAFSLLHAEILEWDAASGGGVELLRIRWR